MVVGIALAAALCYAAAMVLQQHSAMDADPATSLRPKLVIGLLRRPAWLAGMSANAAGYVLRFAALGRGSLIVVQPLLVTSLVLALPASALWHRERLSRIELVGATAIVVGLASFLTGVGSAHGRTTASARAWLLAGAIVAVIAAVGVGAAVRSSASGRRRAARLGGTGGVLLAFAAALTKTTATAFRVHPAHLLVSWPTYALIAVGVVAVVVVQSGFNAGPLSASLPMLMVMETVASVALGVGLFDEPVAGGLLARAAQGGGLLFIVAGVVAVTSSPIVTASSPSRNVVADGT